MAVFKTLKSLKEKSERSSGGSGGLSRENFLSLKSGETVKLFFRQEMAEDGKHFDAERGSANIVFIHVSPLDFTKKFICTADSEENGFRCWACAASKIPGNEKMKKKQRVLINVLALEDGEWTPKILEQSISPRGNMVGNTLIEFAEEYGTLMDREYKFGRVGEKLNTTYSIIPLSPSDVPNADSDVPLVDAAKVYRNVPYEQQEEYFMTDREPVSAGSSDGSDW